MLSKVTLARFRGFQRYSVTFGQRTIWWAQQCRQVNSLIGFATRRVQLRIAMARRPSLYAEDGDVSRQAFPISLENFQSLAESVRFDLTAIIARASCLEEWDVFHRSLADIPDDAIDSRYPLFFLDYRNGGQPRMVADVNKNYRSLGVIPPLARSIHASRSFPRNMFASAWAVAFRVGISSLTVAAARAGRNLARKLLHLSKRLVRRSRVSRPQGLGRRRAA